MVAEFWLFFYVYVTNDLNNMGLTYNCCQKEPLPDLNPQWQQGYSLNIGNSISGRVSHNHRLWEENQEGNRYTKFICNKRYSIIKLTQLANQ